MQTSNAKSRQGLPWTLDAQSQQAIRNAVENADPQYVDMLAARIAQKLPIQQIMPARGARPTISSEMGGMGLDLVSWVRQHPYKLVAMGLGLAGGVFVFIKGINYYFSRK